MAKANTPQTVADLGFVDAQLAHILKNDLVRATMTEIMADFNRVYVEMMTQVIPPGASDELLETLKQNITNVFQAFILGMLEAHNPEGRFYPKFESMVRSTAPRIITQL